MSIRHISGQTGGASGDTRINLVRNPARVAVPPPTALQERATNRGPIGEAPATPSINAPAPADLSPIAGLGRDALIRDLARIEASVSGDLSAATSQSDRLALQSGKEALGEISRRLMLLRTGADLAFDEPTGAGSHV